MRVPKAEVFTIAGETTGPDGGRVFELRAFFKSEIDLQEALSALGVGGKMIPFGQHKAFGE